MISRDFLFSITTSCFFADKAMLLQWSRWEHHYSLKTRASRASLWGYKLEITAEQRLWEIVRLVWLAHNTKDTTNQNIKAIQSHLRPVQNTCIPNFETISSKVAQRKRITSPIPINWTHQINLFSFFCHVKLPKLELANDKFQSQGSCEQNRN